MLLKFINGRHRLSNDQFQRESEKTEIYFAFQSRHFSENCRKTVLDRSNMFTSNLIINRLFTYNFLFYTIFCLFPSCLACLYGLFGRDRTCVIIELMVDYGESELKKIFLKSTVIFKCVFSLTYFIAINTNPKFYTFQLHFSFRDGNFTVYRKDFKTEHSGKSICEELNFLCFKCFFGSTATDVISILSR